MMAFPSMIAEAAAKAGMKVPVDPDEEFSSNEFPHFTVYCAMQLGVPVTWGNHWGNAEIIAAIPEDKIRTMSAGDIFELGFRP